jgi:hypothetical protein
VFDQRLRIVRKGESLVVAEEMGVMRAFLDGCRYGGCLGADFGGADAADGVGWGEVREGILLRGKDRGLVERMAK